MKNYVLNLKRKPFRLGHWIGWQSSRDMSTESVRIRYGVDGADYDTIEDVFRVTHDMELPQAWDMDKIDKAFDVEYACIRLSKETIFREIKELDYGWYALWEDDVVLAVDYHEFCGFFESFKLHPEVQVVAMEKYMWPLQNLQRQRCIRHEKDTIRKWTQREHHLTLPLYKGCLGAGFEHCLVVTPEGARQLVDLGASHPARTYEYFAFNLLPEDAENVWTAVPRMIRNLGYLGSDASATDHNAYTFDWESRNVLDLKN